MGGGGGGGGAGEGPAGMPGGEGVITIRHWLSDTFFFFFPLVRKVHFLTNRKKDKSK